MFSNLKNVFRVPDLRNKILFLMAMVLLYRLGNAIQVPGIDRDAVIQFKALDFNVVLLVVDKFILELEAQLAQKDVGITVSTAAREWLAEEGFDPQMGARPMKRSRWPG